ncbi:MAG: nucleotidyltransferase domain-containing protein [Nanoarchaeota archaeon]|nr:nucleotidyltransferase domain-containing protein [Nanoarchaeota archaeon]
MSNMMIRYAYVYVDFLMESLDFTKINKIILYGSVAKNESDKHSDIDIFIDTDDIKLNRKINNQHDKFYESKQFLKFRALGIDNEISLKVGKLEDWESLYKSMMSTGIVLYSGVEGKKPSSSKHMILFYWDKIGINRGAFLNSLYGFNLKGKRYKGLIEKHDGIKSGKSSVIFPIQLKDEIIKLIKKYKVNAKNIEVFI